MMDPEEVKRLIEAGLNDCQATVTGDGSHFEAHIVCPAFAGKSLIEQQRMVYDTVNAEIASGRLHALSIKTYTPEQWADRV